ncbi:MAG TPA: glycosyltransferase [Chthonomonadaceae bacterium]|nr:glycosyltransferase [Chthonomonadaceae bacterium]
MRILIPTQNYFQPNNGQAVFARHLAEGLAAEGHAVLVLSPSDRCRPYEQVSGSLQVKAVSSRSLAPFYSDVFVTSRPATEVRDALAAFQPDIAHIQDHFPLCRSVVAIASEQGLPLAGTNHFLPENIVPFVPVFSRFARSRAGMQRIMWRQVRHVFDRLARASAPSETAAAILRRQGLPIPVEAISCGVDLRAFHPDASVDRAAMRRRYKMDGERAVFFFVGRVDREKRLDVLLDALPLLNRQDAQLAIAGRGRDLEALQAQARRLGLGERVVILGFVPEQDLNALLNSVDIFVMPSEAELQSIATLEAMAAGRPVLAANARALPELVEEGTNGALFRAGDPADAAARMAFLLDMRARWEEMGQASLARAQQHSLPNTIRRYQEFYRRALDARVQDVIPQERARGVRSPS